MPRETPTASAGALCKLGGEKAPPRGLVEPSSWQMNPKKVVGLVGAKIW